MKKILLVLSMLCAITLVGCGNDVRKNNLQNNQSQLSKVTFESRTAEFVKFQNEKFKENELRGYIYAENLIKNVRLEKIEDEYIYKSGVGGDVTRDNAYVLKVDIVNPTSFSEEEIKNKVIQMKNDNLKSIALGEYTIYKDAKTLLENIKYDGYEERINKEMFVYGDELINYENMPVFVLKDGMPYKLIVSRESAEKYNLVELMVAGDSEVVAVEDVTTDAIEIELLASDIIHVTQLDGAGAEGDIKVTVEEYYNNALANKVESNGYAYDINNMSTSSGWHGEYMDALEVRDGAIYVFYISGGV